MTARRRRPHRKNTRRACGRCANRERPAAPYRTGDTSTARAIPPTGEDGRTQASAAIREAGYHWWFRFRASAPVVLAPAEPGNGPAGASGTGPGTAERDAS